MNALVLVINTGSSSIKFSLSGCDADGNEHRIAKGQVDNASAPARLTVDGERGERLADQTLTIADPSTALTAIHAWCCDRFGIRGNLAGIGHRVVHGGTHFSQPVRIDAEVLSKLEALVPLAPMHQPGAIAAIRASIALAPDVPQIACFDTAFHARQPVLAGRFGLPRDITSKGVRRYGFHGLSCEYIVRALPEVATGFRCDKVIVAHLGSGASLCAVDSGRSIASTMGFTPLDGLVMATRSGSLDPGALLYLLRHEGMDAQALEHLLYTKSGLLGVSGISGDIRVLLASDAPEAKEAIDLFVYRIARELGSLVAALGGLDALVFTGGIGEHAPEIRAQICRDARWIGVDLNAEANARGESRISTQGAAVSAWVIPTDENRVIDRHVRRVLAA